jgi:TolB protein
MRAVLLRYSAVVAIGLAVLGGILFYASTVDGRPPLVERIVLTLHVSDDERLALTTTAIEVEFSEAVQAASAEAAFRLEPSAPGEFSWSGSVLRYTPQQRLPLDTEFSVRVEAGVIDESGNRMAEPADAFEFRTVGPPSVAATEPADDATGVPIDAPIVIRFSSLMDTASVEGALRIQPDIAFEPEWSAEQLTLLPSQPLREGTRYVVTIGAAASDTAGNRLDAAHSFSFESAPAPVRPSALFPADDTVGVAPITPVAVFLDREVDPDGDLDDYFSIEPDVAGTLEVVAAPGAAGLLDPSESVLRFEPSAPLVASTTYRVTLEAGLAAVDGSRMAEAVEWSFTTGSPLGTLSNQLVFLSDRAGVANLWAMNPDGTGQRQLTAELSPVSEYAVSPDGRRVLVADGARLVLQNSDGTDREVLTEGDVIEFDPAWAPDGSRFVFGRAELESGSGLGLWTRASDGGDERQVDIPDGPESATPSPRASGDDGDSVLRAPRYAPDGSALAFVDGAGRVGILEAEPSRLTSARVAAVGPPVWLPDSSSVLLTLLPGGEQQPFIAGAPLPVLDPEGLSLDAEQLASLEIARLDRGAASVRPVGLPPGARQPAVSGDRLLYVLEGRVMLSQDPRDPRPGRSLLTDEGAPAAWAAFGVEPRSVLVERRPARGSLPSGGVWLVDTLTGRAEQLTEDGWRPRWLP